MRNHCQNRVDAPSYSPSEWSQRLKAKALEFGAGDGWHLSRYRGYAFREQG